jgi:hypothetical protein
MITVITMITLITITITMTMMMMMMKKMMMMISRIQDVRVNIGTVAPRWFLIYLYARVFLL